MGHGCSEEKDLEFPRCKGMSNTMQMHKNRHSKDTVLSKKMSLYKYYTSSTRTSRGRKFPVYKKNINLQETSKPIEKKNHALQGSDGDGQPDATRQCAAHSGWNEMS